MHESTPHGADLNHCGDICLDVCLLNLGIGAVADAILEVFAVEGPTDEALVDTTGGAQERKGEDGKPKPPIKDLFGLSEVAQPEYVDGFLHPPGHFGDVLVLTG